MVTIFRTDKIRYEGNDKYIAGELRGMSTDTKPIKIGDATIDNGSVYVEIDTQKLSFYDLESQTWKEV